MMYSVFGTGLAAATRHELRRLFTICGGRRLSQGEWRGCTALLRFPDADQPADPYETSAGPAVLASE